MSSRDCHPGAAENNPADTAAAENTPADTTAAGRRPRLDATTALVRHRLEAFLRARAPRGSSFIVGVSGGADSMALAAAAGHLQEAATAARHGFTFRAVTVDHGLQDGSTAIAERTLHALTRLGLDAQIATVQVPGGMPDGIESAARRARYAALEHARQQHGATAVLTAHTLDDQAETVLLGLARGSGARSLAGMRPVTGTVWRPLLDVTREQTRALCRTGQIPIWDDPMNADPTYARVRVRATVLPVLERELGPGIAVALARSARLLADDSDELETQAGEAAAGLDIVYPVPPDSLPVTARGSVGRLPAASAAPDPARGSVGRLPAAASAVNRALRLRIVRDWLGAAGARQEVTSEHVAAVDELLMRVRNGAVSLPPAARVTRVRAGQPSAGALELRYL